MKFFKVMMHRLAFFWGGGGQNWHVFCLFVCLFKGEG